MDKDGENNRSQSKGILGKVMDFTVMKFGSLFKVDEPEMAPISLRINDNSLKSERAGISKRSSVLNPLKPPLAESKQIAKSDPKDQPADPDSSII